VACSNIYCSLAFATDFVFTGVGIGALVGVSIGALVCTGIGALVCTGVEGGGGGGGWEVDGVLTGVVPPLNPKNSATAAAAFLILLTKASYFPFM
jgi:hypothetical protein